MCASGIGVLIQTCAPGCPVARLRALDRYGGLGGLAPRVHRFGHVEEMVAINLIVSRAWLCNMLLSVRVPRAVQSCPVSLETTIMPKRGAESQQPDASFPRPKKLALTTGTTGFNGVNAEFLEHIQTCLAAIQRHPHFLDIHLEDPLEQGKGGREAPLDPVTMNFALSSPSGCLGQSG